MKVMQILNKFHERINIILICFFVLTLVISNNLNSYSIILLVSFNIYIYWNLEYFKKVIKTRYYLLFVLYFTVLVISYLHSNNSQYAIKFIERNVSFIILPIGIAFLSKQPKVQIKFLTVFVCTTAILISYSIVAAFGKNIIFNIKEHIPLYNLKSWFFTYHYLAENVNISAIYLSLVVAFAALVLIYHELYNEILMSSIINRFKWGLIIILNLGLVLLLARTILAYYILMVIIMLGIYSYQKKKLIKFFIGFFTVGLFLVLFVYSNDVLFLRIIGGFQKFEETKYFSGGLFSRLYQWNAIYDLFIENNILLGFSTGDAQIYYNEAYENSNLTWAKEANFNVHNMYLESLFSTGILGFFSLCSILIVSIYRSIKSNNFIYLLFLLLFSTAGLTESLLNRQQGIIFFIFINFLFYYNLNKAQFESSNFRH